MAVTRDSAAWWLGIGGSILLYLSMSPPIMEWTYAQWVQAGSLLVATISGKLATSPLKGAHDVPEL